MTATTWMVLPTVLLMVQSVMAARASEPPPHEGSGPPNFVFILIDDLRWDAMIRLFPR